jgi:transcriptional regulator of acetoin/glycerol metabolism
MTNSDKPRPEKKARRRSQSRPCPSPSHEEAERATLLHALALHRGNLTAAAQAVGYTREELLRVLRQHGIVEAM